MTGRSARGGASGAWETGQVRRIAYQGEPGANSHLVCKQHYPDAEAVACASFEDVFAAVEGGEADLAMIPIDNSIAGRVADIHHFLPHSSLHIVAEHFMPIHFHLMAPAGTTLKTIREVHSHVHALGQCRKIIRKHGWKTVIAGDTAGAAREIAAAGGTSAAALAPRLAADLYGLSIVAENVEDTESNVTRFVVLSRDAAAVEGTATRSSSPPSSSTCATFRPRSTRRSAVSRRTAST